MHCGLGLNCTDEVSVCFIGIALRFLREMFVFLCASFTDSARILSSLAQLLCFVARPLRFVLRLNRVACDPLIEDQTINPQSLAHRETHQ